jgi:peptidoglycan hydrolase-like protein with peptidoglycan-binding domain
MIVLPPLRLSSTGPEVGNLQRFLNEMRVSDPNGDALAVDEAFGKKTLHALRSFQADYGLVVDGVFGTRSRQAAMLLGFVPFLQAKHCRILWPNRARRPSVIVVHTVECAESPRADENVATWFARGADDRKVSAHFVVDDDSAIQCVRVTDEAWHANQANGFSVGIEHAGYARQSHEQWSDAYSTAMLVRSSYVARRIADAYGIPIRRLLPDQLRAGESGFVGHADVNEAYQNLGGHEDPGSWFPWTEYLELVRNA